MDSIQINRAPVLTLWAVVVAQRLGFERDEALTIGKALAGLTAHAKGTRLGIFEPTPEAVKELRSKQRTDAGVFPIAFMGRHVPVQLTEHGLRAVNKDKAIAPTAVTRYLSTKFANSLETVTQAMESLAGSQAPDRLAHEAFDLYMEFRPDVSAGKAGWGATGTLSLSLLEELKNQAPSKGKAPN